MKRSEALYGSAGESGARQLALLVDQVIDYAIFLLDPDGNVASWNRGAQRMKGYAAEEITGRHFSIFYTDEDRDRDHPAEELEIATREGRYGEEGWRVRKDGTWFWAHVVITALRDDHGELVGFAKVTRDLTERRAAEQALRATNAELARVNRELDRFAAVAAHDLREPLRTVSGFSQLLVERYAGALDALGRDYLQHIARAAERMATLVDGLLAYARSGGVAPPPVPVELAAIVGLELADLHAAIDERGAAVEVDVPEEAAVLASDHDVAVVLRNLLSNAVKFADPAQPSVRLSARRAEGMWRVEVADNGIGIDPVHRPRIFDPFHRIHSSGEYPGTGLGLAIAQRVVERHGGAIGVESAAGAGSRFWFALPAAGDQ